MNELNDPVHSLRLVRRMTRLVWKVAPRWTVAVAVLCVLTGVLPLVPLYLVKVLVDTLTPGPASAEHVLELVALVGAIGLVVLVAGAVQRYASAKQSFLVIDEVKGLMEAKGAELDLAHFERPDFHDALHRAQMEADTGPRTVINTSLQLLSSSVGLIAVAALIAALDWWVGILLVLAALPGLWVRRVHARRLFRLQREQTPAMRMGWYYGWLVTSPLTAHEVRSHGLGRLFASRSRETREQVLGQMVGLLRTRTVHEALADALAIVTATGLLAYVAVRAAHGTITVGELVVFYAAVQRGQSMFGQMSSSLSTLLQGSLFLSHLYDFLDLQPRVMAPATPQPVPAPVREGIAFDGVTHVYEGARRPAVAGVDLTIRLGERIALVGRNGAGKSTLIKLMMRLYDPTAGRITLDGVDLRALDPDELRARFAVVVQDHVSYELPAGESIALGDIRNPPDQARVETAARSAGAHERIMRLREGYATRLGRHFEGGEALSVGEWQRIALARGLVRDAPIVVLDEPTSAMDASAERELVRRFDEVIGDRTAVVVSHRLSTVRAADRIVVMEEGSIVETGTHDELIERGDAYAALFTDLRGAPPLPSG
jgi:ATP-binding cassette subfamily B protein